MAQQLIPSDGYNGHFFADQVDELFNQMAEAHGIDEAKELFAAKTVVMAGPVSEDGDPLPIAKKETLSDRQWVFLKNVALLIQYAEEQGIKLTGGELHRTKYQQKQYIRTGRSKTMNSKHLKSLAIDFNFFIDGKLTYNKRDVEVLGDYWETLDPRNKWGGRWHFADVPHFQMADKRL